MTPPADTPLAERIDQLLADLRKARRLVITPSVKAILDHAIYELAYMRADLLPLERAPRRRREQRTAEPRTTAESLRGSNLAQWLAKNNPVDGTRLCAGPCGRWLPFSAYDQKSPGSTAFRSHCRDCWKHYQRQRYVAAGKQAVILEVLDGDEIVGATCNCCGRPFEIGDLLAAGALRHRDCQPTAAEAEPSKASDTSAEMCGAKWMYRGRARAVCHGPAGHEGRHWNGTVKWSDTPGAPGLPEAPAEAKPSRWAADLRDRTRRINEQQDSDRTGRHVERAPTAAPIGRMTAEQDRIADMLADRHAAATGIPRR